MFFTYARNDDNRYIKCKFEIPKGAHEFCYVTFSKQNKLDFISIANIEIMMCYV